MNEPGVKGPSLIASIGWRALSFLVCVVSFFLVAWGVAELMLWWFESRNFAYAGFLGELVRIFVAFIVWALIVGVAMSVVYRLIITPLWQKGERWTAPGD